MRKFGNLFLSLAAASLMLAGCAKTPDQNVAQNQSVPDPNAAADGNLAPVNAQPDQTQTAAAPAPAPADDSSAAYSAAYQDVADDQGQPVYAPDPPPPLPEYSQPPCPGDNYLWTPGYWSYADAGYYWVPGAWVLAPYVDALWTPPYWDFFGGRYRWHRGYWGDHIGFYGGINYGFGYTGRGYYGGYWNGGNFAYNRAVTNINVTIVHNVYNRGVANNVRSNRVSYNGGPGGTNVRPIPAELAVLHERRTAPVPAQIEHERTAASNRAQFASANRGRPTLIAQAQPLPTSYRAPAARPSTAEQLKPLAQNAPGREAFRPGQAPQPFQNERPVPAGRPEAPALRNQPQSQPVQNQPVQNQPQNPRAEPNRPTPEPRPAAPEVRQSPQAPRPEPQLQGRPVPQARPVAPEPRPVQQPAARPEPAARPQRAPERPAPQVRPEPQARPEPAARPTPAARPAAPPAKPAPAARPEPKEKEERH